MKAEWLIYLAGIHALGFALFHIYFWRLFKWKTELAKLHTPTRAITQMLNIQLIYFAFGTSILCFFYTEMLLYTAFGNILLVFYSGFWFVRLVQQFIFLRYNHWMIHVTTVLFILGCLLFALPLIFLN
jgi:hypothetical protein